MSLCARLAWFAAAGVAMLVAQEAYSSQQEGCQSSPQAPPHSCAAESDSYTGRQEAGQVLQDVLSLVRPIPKKDKQLDAPS